MDLNVHPALELAFEIWAYIFGILIVFWVINKLTRSNTTFEDAKILPGGLHYQEPEKFDEEIEELGYRAHA